MIEIKTQGLQFFVAKDRIRVSPFFNTVEAANSWLNDHKEELNK